MINVLSRRHYRYTVQNYLETWGRSQTHRFKFIPYEGLAVRFSVPDGVFIFTDLDRLNNAEQDLAKQVLDQLSAAGIDGPLLNNPHRVLLRYDLLHTLHREGINRYRAFRLSENLEEARYPLFLRSESSHSGSLSELLETPEELRENIRKLLKRGHRASDLLVVEFCDTSDERGIFRKYSTFIVGGRVVPRHLVFSRDWMQKFPDLLDEEMLEEERCYLLENPHEEWVLRVCRLAGIDYGRIDYSLSGGVPQVWEINTNPTVMLRPHKYDKTHLPNQELFAERIAEAFESLAPESSTSPVIPLQLSWRLRLRLLFGQLRRPRRRLRRYLVPRRG